MATIPTLTTEAKIIARIGQMAINLRIDDLGTAVTSVISEASSETYLYLGQLYSSTSLAASEWVQWQTTNIAVYLLCLRRLNDAPTSAQTAYEKTLQMLEKVRLGQITLPGVPMLRAAAPSLGNQRVDLQPVPHVVTSPSRSAGQEPSTVRGPVDIRDIDPYD
jgi:phage gp36-like protein